MAPSQPMAPEDKTLVPFREALKRTQSNPSRSWPGRGDNCRLEPECWPTLRPSFRITKNSRIFTVGSCFARNIEWSLTTAGFDLPALALAGSLEQGANSGILNKYTPASIFQELAWAARVSGKTKLEAEDVRDLFFYLPDGRVIDMHLHAMMAEPFEVALRRREAIAEIFNTAFSCDVIVITLGYIEAWWDSKLRLFISGAPNRGMSREADRFFFTRLSYDACVQYLRSTIELLNSSGGKQFLITTSPVPLSRTFTTDDVIIANNYSKSMLRTVVGSVAEDTACVDYFPSYESVILTKQPYVWQDDLIHVDSSFVNQIMARVRHAYVADADEGRPADFFAEDIISLTRRGDLAQAIDRYRAYHGDVFSIDNVLLHVVCAELMQEAGEIELALRHARRQCSGSGKADDAYRMARVIRRCGLPDEATRIENSVLPIIARKTSEAITFVNLLLQDGRMQEAAALLDRIERSEIPSNIALRLVKIYDHCGNSQAAVEFLVRVAQNDTGSIPVTLEAVSRLKQDLKWERILEILNAALEVNRTSFQLFYEKQACLRQLGLQQEAIACMQEAVFIFSDNHRPLAVLGNLLAGIGKTDEAIAAFRSAQDLAPDSPNYAKRINALLMRTERANVSDKPDQPVPRN